MFGRLELDAPEASCQPTKDHNKQRKVYTRGYLLAFQTKCLNRPANLGHIPGVTLEQPEIQVTVLI